MKDIITYIEDLTSFRQEIKEKAKTDNEFFTLEGENVILNLNKIPVYYHGDGIRSLCLVRLTNQKEIETFNSLTSCKRIGECIDGAYVFDEDGEEIYNSVYDRSTRIVNGEEYTPPEILGAFF